MTSIAPRPDGPISVFREVRDALGAVEGVPNTGRLMTAQEAASFVGVHPNTVYLAAQNGELRYRAIGRLRRFTEEDVLAWTEVRP